jgi:transposase
MAPSDSVRWLVGAAGRYACDPPSSADAGRRTPVALETGTVAFLVARELTALGCTPSVIDAREVRLKAPRPTQKSDRRDACELCDGLRCGIYRAVAHVPPPAVTRVRETLARRRHFVRLETAQVNAVKRLLRGAGLGHRSRSLRLALALAVPGHLDVRPTHAAAMERVLAIRRKRCEH